MDSAPMGVGGDDSWSPTVHDEYLLPPGKYQLGVAMTAVGAGVDGMRLYAAAKQVQLAAATATAMV